MVRRLVVVSFALVLGGCGSTTFGGLGPDDDDSGLFGDTSSAGGDAIFPTDDVVGADGTKVDSTALDTGGTIDTGALTDSTVADTAVADSGVDSGPLDTGPDDTGTPDTGTPDTGIVDTGTTDSGTIDTGPTDTGGPTWPSVVGQMGCYDTESSPEKAVQCDKHCCGSYGFDFSWHWRCGDDCGFGGRTYACDQTADCGGGQVCCTGTNGFGTVNGSGCRTGTNCGGDKQLCASTADCASGKTCKAYTPPDTKFTVGSCE